MLLNKGNQLVMTEDDALEFAMSIIEQVRRKNNFRSFTKGVSAEFPDGPRGSATHYATTISVMILTPEQYKSY